MKALVITTKDTAYVRDFAPPMSQTAEKVIGDWVERVRPTGLPGYLMLVDENGRLKNLPMNLAGSLFYGAQFHGDPIVGNIVVAGDNREKVPQGLTEKQISHVFEEANRLMKRFGSQLRWEEPK